MNHSDRLATPESSGDPWGTARARWPTISVSESALDEYVHSRRIPLDALTPALRADLYLAVGCFANVANAVPAFTREYASTITGVVRPLDTSPAFADEVRQLLAETLFVGNAKRERCIGQYRATGPLGGWVRTAARRIALRLRKNEASERLVSDDVLVGEVAAVCDQELALTKSHSAVEFRRALSQAIKNLEARDRTLMKLHLVAGLTTVQIAKSFHLSQSSVSRSVRNSARKVLSEVKEMLRHSLGAASSDVEALFDLVQSQVDLTLSVVEDLPFERR